MHNFRCGEGPGLFGHVREGPAEYVGRDRVAQHTALPLRQLPLHQLPQHTALPLRQLAQPQEMALPLHQLPQHTALPLRQLCLLWRRKRGETNSRRRVGQTIVMALPLHLAFASATARRAPKNAS